MISNAIQPYGAQIIIIFYSALGQQVNYALYYVEHKAISILLIFMTLILKLVDIKAPKDCRLPKLLSTNHRVPMTGFILGLFQNRPCNAVDYDYEFGTGRLAIIRPQTRLQSLSLVDIFG